MPGGGRAKRKRVTARARGRESVRWTEGDERMAETARPLPGTRLVYVADREADRAERMPRAHALGSPADGLIRSKHTRGLPDGGKRWAAVLAGAPLGEIEFMRPSRHGQAARTVRQQIFARQSGCRTRRPAVGDLLDDQGDGRAHRRQARRVATAD